MNGCKNWLDCNLFLYVISGCTISYTLCIFNGILISINLYIACCIYYSLYCEMESIKLNLNLNVICYCRYIHWHIQGMRRERVHLLGLGQKQSNQPVFGQFLSYFIIQHPVDAIVPQ